LLSPLARKPGTVWIGPGDVSHALNNLREDITMTKGMLGRGIIGLSALLLAAPAAADITITLRGIEDGKQTLIEVRNGVVRMSEQGAPEYSLYDKAHDRFIVVKERNGTYMQIDRAMLRQMSTQMAGMRDMVAAQREQLRAQLQDMPAGQRAVMEAQMAANVSSPASIAGPMRCLTAPARRRRCAWPWPAMPHFPPRITPH